MPSGRATGSRLFLGGGSSLVEGHFSLEPCGQRFAATGFRRRHVVVVTNETLNGPFVQVGQFLIPICVCRVRAQVSESECPYRPYMVENI